jgi:hypothetical protein
MPIMIGNQWSKCQGITAARPAAAGDASRLVMSSRAFGRHIYNATR